MSGLSHAWVRVMLGSKGPKGAMCTSGLAASGTCMTCTACKASVPMPTSKVA